MTTLEALQRLPDGKFHRLCDDLLRRVEPRYARLRTHGLNEKDESIVGQPDSYIGDSAATCRVAFCYTVQERSWWTKVVDDVGKAVAGSPNVGEVVVAVPWDMDRDGPTKGENIDWLSQAKAAAARAIFGRYDGPEIARILDADHQDLRHLHLGIPYSRLTYPAILASCQASNAAAIEELRLHGRYDPDRYLFREADRELFGVWQGAWRDENKGSGCKEAVRLVALVNHSGLGKTSLLCSFVESLSPCLPVLLLQARHLSFDAEDSLVRAVVQSLQGVLSAELAREEEVAVAHHLARHSRLTVVLDGLDESGSPTAVRRAMRYWLASTLGQNGLLVVSSRREFWAACVDRAWGRWMPSSGRQRDREAAAPAQLDRQLDPSQGLPLPGFFSPEELERAWGLAGQSATALHGLPPDVREELQHPFTLRAYADLLGHADTVSLRTRTDIMSAWLESRLGEEEEPETRLTADVYRDALRVVARKINAEGEGWVAVDQLNGVPRFDASKPPGPAVERMLQAGILESMPGRAERIRFVFEAVQDFFLVEDDAELADRDPILAACQFGEGTYTKAYIRLDRLGRRTVVAARRGEFLDALADLDPVRAAVVLRACPSAYEPQLREKVIGRLRQDVASRHRVKAAFAVDLLGRLDCPESRRVLIEALPPHGSCPWPLLILGAWALTRLGCVERVEFVYASPRFRLSPGFEAYYYQEDLEIVRGASPEFRRALGDHAIQFLAAESGTSDHTRAVYVLAHLGDDRLVPNLEDRVAGNGLLQEYENHALVALGTESAARLFVTSIRGTAVWSQGVGYKDGGRARLGAQWSIMPYTADFRYLITPGFEVMLRCLVEDSDVEVADIALAYAMLSRSLDLLRISLLAMASRPGLRGRASGQASETVDPRTWMSWWRAADSGELRQTLLTATSQVPTAEVEQVLLDCLEHPDLRWFVVDRLCSLGSVRAAARLRSLLDEGPSERDTFYIAKALGDLADTAAVPTLARLAETKMLPIAAVSLGAVGNEEAERSLVTLLDQGASPDWVACSLILHGSPTAVARGVAEAQRGEERGPRWLIQGIKRAYSWFRRPRGRYHTHIHDGLFVEYLLANESIFKGEDKWDVLDAVEPLDSDNVRKLLRELASREGTPEDEVVRQNDGLRASTLAYQDLLDRGDCFAAGHYVREATSLDERRAWVASRDLGKLPREEVAYHLRLAFDRAGSDAERALVVRLLGFFGFAESL